MSTWIRVEEELPTKGMHVELRLSDTPYGTPSLWTALAFIENEPVKGKKWGMQIDGNRYYYVRLWREILPC